MNTSHTRARTRARPQATTTMIRMLTEQSVAEASLHKSAYSKPARICSHHQLGRPHAHLFAECRPLRTRGMPGGYIANTCISASVDSTVPRSPKTSRPQFCQLFAVCTAISRHATDRMTTNTWTTSTLPGQCAEQYHHSALRIVVRCHLLDRPRGMMLSECHLPAAAGWTQPALCKQAAQESLDCAPDTCHRFDIRSYAISGAHAAGTIQACNCCLRKQRSDRCVYGILLVIFCIYLLCRGAELGFASFIPTQSPKPTHTHTHTYTHTHTEPSYECT